MTIEQARPTTDVAALQRLPEADSSIDDAADPTCVTTGVTDPVPVGEPPTAPAPEPTGDSVARRKEPPTPPKDDSELDRVA